jgi:hypothetical protein
MVGRQIKSTWIAQAPNMKNEAGGGRGMYLNMESGPTGSNIEL